jgi:autotransporter translocation and assembly factor TamB
MWRGEADDHSSATLTGVVAEAGTDLRLPVDGTLTVRLGRVVRTEMHLRFGDGRITAAGDFDLAPTSLDRLVGQTQQLLGLLLHQASAPGQVTLPGRMEGGRLEPEDVDVSIDLVRLLRVALRAVR